jgi:CRISPR system Cascade subunit CasB
MTPECPGPPYFQGLCERYQRFTPGQKAELRRCAEPNDLTLTPAFYRLFPGERPDQRHRRLAFLLPWCAHRPKARPLATQLAEAKVAEARILQVARARSPRDNLIQLRRLVMHINPEVDWIDFGRALWFWGQRAKRRLVEDFYLARLSPKKGDQA